MKIKSIPVMGLLHAVGAAIYIALITFGMSHASQIFGEKDNPPFTGMAALMLFVLSVAVMAMLIFVRPLLWYIDGKKREALALLAWTIGSFFALTIIVFAGLLAIR